MKLEGQRVTLVPLGLAYLDSTHAYASDAETCRYMMYLPNETVEETAAFLSEAEAEWQKEKPRFYEFAILINEARSQRHIGAVSAHRDMDEPNAYEMGWIMNREYQGQGYAYEAAKLVRDMLIDRFSAERIFAHCDLENEASSKLMKKLGMVEISRDGRRRNKGADKESYEMYFEMKIE